ncbi:MAG: cytochrome c3 family protein [Planctomycetes bacterium]|nr:cytochrome c3 family protein [Planctomycetota bacterium]
MILLRIALFTLFAATAARAQNSCVDCHEAQKAPMEKSVHALSCVECHNGDDQAADQEGAHAVAKNFLGKPAPLQLAAMCGSCHKKEAEAWRASPHFEALAKGDPAGATCASCHTAADDRSSHAILKCGGTKAVESRLAVAADCARCHSNPDLMGRSGLRVDQFAQYEKSAHGHNILVEKGGDAATCSDCHEPHGALRASNPQSETNVKNQAKTCGACHGDSAVMEKHEIDTDVVAEYESSPHGRNLGNGAPSCAGCHLPHAARVPPAEEMAQLCGRCHQGPARELAAGPHGTATRVDPESGVALPVHCGHCHEAHGAPRPAAPFATSTCAPCHDESSKGLAAGRALSDLSAATLADLRELHGLFTKAQLRGHFQGERCEALSALDAASIDQATLAHGVSVEKCRRAREEFTKDAKDLKVQLTGMAPQTRPRGWLTWMWAFLLGGVLLMWAKSRKTGTA